MNDLNSLIKQQALSGNTNMLAMLNRDKWSTDMEAAPKDGTRVILYFAITQKKYYAQWFEPMWYVEGGEGILNAVEPCAWRYDIPGPQL